MVSLLLTIAICQDAQPSARALIDSVTDRDPAASFRAISDLVDLADTRREEVEKEASRLPAFYREVLLSELKTKRELGERFGRGARIDLKGAGLRFWDFVDEVGRNPGMAIDINPYLREHFGKELMEVDLRNVWPLQALVILCDRSNHIVSGVWEGKVSVNHRGYPTFPYKPPPWFFYRNIAIPQPAPRWRKLIDFGGPPRWRAIFRISPTLGPETQVVMWKDLKLIDALGEDGKELKLVAPEDTAIPGSEWTSPSGVPEQMDIAFDVGERKESRISRLRCSVVGRVPREWRRHVLEKLDGPDGGRFEDKDFEFTIRDPSPEDLPFSGYQPEIQIRPKSIPHADLKGVPVSLRLHFDTKNAPGWWSFTFSGQGESTVSKMHWMGSLRPATYPGGEKVRRLLSVEVLIPMGLQDRPIFMEFRDIPLK
ncbi:MAG TPA: hypothetical protein VGK70_00200 [Thermoanaerobaculia bacterium]